MHIASSPFFRSFPKIRPPLPFFTYIHRHQLEQSALSVVKDQINDQLFGTVSWELSVCLGHAPKNFHQYRPICMNFANLTFSYILSSNPVHGVLSLPTCTRWQRRRVHFKEDTGTVRSELDMCTRDEPSTFDLVTAIVRFSELIEWKTQCSSVGHTRGIPPQTATSA